MKVLSQASRMIGGLLAAAVIVTLILLGRWLEARARGHTGSAIRRLISGLALPLISTSSLYIAHTS